MKRALIIGASGQDGTLLARFLKQNGYSVAGAGRRGGSESCDESVALDVRDTDDLRSLVRRVRPDELYYLAAFHRSSQGASESEGEASSTFDINLGAYVTVLEASIDLEPRPRIFYACSSLIFGESSDTAMTERSPASPACLYSISKQAGRLVSERFRADAGMHVCVGILFNHESSLRPEGFLSRRIVEGVRSVQRGNQRDVVVGDMNALCDWGYAGDYVQAMWRMLQHENSDTYVVATGQLHSVADWVGVSCGLAGLDPRTVVREDPTLLTRKRPVVRGDSTLLKNRTGWAPATRFDDMVAKMYRGEV